MSGFFDIYSIIFLVIAVVIFMRLGSVLGRRTGNEPSSYDASVNRGPGTAKSGNDNIVALPGRDRSARPDSALELDLEAIDRHAKPGSDLHDGLVAILKTSPDFDPGQFLDGAKMAYEMVVTAFADGDRTTLKNLLAADVFDGFVSAIAEREAREERVESTFVGVNEAKITHADLEERNARLTIRFDSELISATRDRDGAVVDGDPATVQTVRDVWTFSRDVKSRDPNWKLVATEAV
jgi:predicted lipid-binding transport protein (Tim44 family)